MQPISRKSISALALIATGLSLLPFEPLLTVLGTWLLVIGIFVLGD